MTTGPSATLIESLTAWIRERVTHASARGLAVGLSGGIDSAVVARLSQLAMPDTTIAVILPCHSDARDEADARLVAEHYTMPTLKVPLEDPHDSLVDTLRRATGSLQSPADPVAGGDTPASKLPMANVKPRLRMVSLYFIANTLNYLVAGTGNRSEIAIGYFTKHGDGAADLLPIGNLLKSDVRALARGLGMPDAILEKPPSAGLWPGQTDETEMGFTYADLEAYLETGPEAVAPAMALRIERLMRASEHKRMRPPIPPDERTTLLGPGRG